MKYFVTGATGFIGGRLVRALVARGHEVNAVVRNPATAQDLAALGVNIQAGDITDKDSMRQPMTGVDGVFHLAAWYKIGVKDGQAEQINVGGTRNVLELMRELGIPKGVYTSTLAIFSNTHGQVVDESYRFDGKHLSKYDRTKWEAHYHVALPMIQQGLPLVIVQPGVVYGPGDPSAMGDTLRQYLQRKLPLVPQKTAFTWAHVDDIAEGHILAMEKGKPGETYIIAGPAHTLVDALAIAEKATGIPAPRMQAPPALMKAMAGAMGLVERFVKLPDAYTSEGLRVSAGVTYLGSNAKARRELGYMPRPLEEGLPETLRAEM
jgi:nucleoside-diphosphate-sugar epimerase